jgi:ribokinase
LASLRTAVVGHVEWVEFVRVPHLPVPGEIVHAEHAWDEPGGGGAVAAVQLSKLGEHTTFFTALSDTDLGRTAHAALLAKGLRVEAVFRDTFQRRAVTHIDDDSERTITVIGDRMNPNAADVLPWNELVGIDAIYFTGGDVGALQASRRARVLVATSRVLPLLAEAGVQLDVVVGSAADPSERYVRGDVTPEPHVAVRTEGGFGGSYERADGTTGRWAPVQLEAPVRDAYGCGDSFAAGLTFGLGSGMSLDDALHLGARCGAAVLTGNGPYEGQLTSDSI